MKKLANAIKTLFLAYIWLAWATYTTLSEKGIRYLFIDGNWKALVSFCSRPRKVIYESEFYGFSKKRLIAST